MRLGVHVHLHWLFVGVLWLNGCAGNPFESSLASSKVPAHQQSSVPAIRTASGPVPQQIAPSPERVAQAEEILRKADEVRNPQMDYTITATVTSYSPDIPTRTATYEVLVKGRELSVVKTLSPPTDRGRVLLMRGKDLWAFLPTVSKPLRISLRERLIGDVANGDVARTNFSGDYTPTLLRTESVEDTTQDVLGLSANANDVTYGKVVLWVAQHTFHPTRAEFYTISGRLLKTCSYERYQQLGGRLRPSRLVMTDALTKGQHSVIEYDRMVVAPLPDKYFTKDYMKKFME